MGAGDGIAAGQRHAVLATTSAPSGQSDAALDTSSAPVTQAPAQRAAKASRAANAGAAPRPRAPRHSERAASAVPAPAVPNWADDELTGFRAALLADIARLREELNMGAADMADLLADTEDGAGDDQADAGSKTLEREQEMSVNANARDLLDQSTHALRRLESGAYGTCESCGKVIPAARLRAFPRATLCIACKQAEERR